MWWSLAGAVLSFTPFYYCLLSIILIVKWVIWFPVMIIRHGLDDFSGCGPNHRGRTISH